MDAPQETFFDALSRIASEQKINFLLVGGNAVNAYGYLRATYDIDVAVPDEHAAAWRSAFESMGYTMFFGTEAFQRFKGRENHSLFQLALMFLSSDTSIKLRAESRQLSVGTRTLPVASPLHLMAMKLHALKQPHRAADGKDLLDIVGLIRAAQIDVQSSDFQAIFIQHADPATREKLLRDIAQPG